MTTSTRTFPAATEPVQEDGWMAPDGKFYPCGYASHSRFAESVEQSVWGLENAGWLHISDGVICNHPMERNKTTQAQKDSLFDMMMLSPDSYLGKSIGLWIAPDKADWNE